MSDIVGFEACSAELRRLLDEITENIRDAEDADQDEFQQVVMAEARKLVDFTNCTQPADPFDAAERDAVRRLDLAADEARRDLYGDAAAAIIARMHDRISQLNQLEKDVRRLAAEAEREAAKLRLVPVRSALDALTDTVQAIKDAREALSDEEADEAALKAKMDSALRALAALERTARKLLGGDGA